MSKSKKIRTTAKQRVYVRFAYRNFVPLAKTAEMLGITPHRVRLIAHAIGCSHKTKEDVNKHRRVSLEYWYRSRELKLGRPYEHVNS